MSENSPGDEILSPEELLRREVSGLEVDEVLALCYTFATKPQRLRLYLDILRRQGGVRAQFACCLVCFDLARQGDVAAESEFNLLVDTVRVLSEDQQMVQNLVGDDDYLSFIWELLEAQLEEMDDRFDASTESITQEKAATEDLFEIDLFSDDDFGEMDLDDALSIDEDRLRGELQSVVSDFLGVDAHSPVYTLDMGFRLGSRRDTHRVENFLQSLDSLREPVPESRGYRALALLFYGTHMRSKTLFGGVNEAKQQTIAEGLREFLQSGDQLTDIVGILSYLHADEHVWSKISEVLMDYLLWMARSPKEIRLNPDSYPAVDRQSRRDQLFGGARRSARKKRRS